MLENPIEIIWFRRYGLLQTFVTKLISGDLCLLAPPPSSFPLIAFQNCYAFILLPLSSTTRQTMEGCRGMYVLWRVSAPFFHTTYEYAKLIVGRSDNGIVLFRTIANLQMEKVIYSCSDLTAVVRRHIDGNTGQNTIRLVGYSQCVIYGSLTANPTTIKMQ